MPLTNGKYELEFALVVARSALEFYSDSMDYPLAIENWRHFKVLRDAGSRAREALAELDKLRETPIGIPHIKVPPQTPEE